MVTKKRECCVRYYNKNFWAILVCAKAQTEKTNALPWSGVFFLNIVRYHPHNLGESDASDVSELSAIEYFRQDGCIGVGKV